MTESQFEQVQKLRDRTEKSEAKVEILTMDRDVWKARAEREIAKLAVWRETLAGCVEAMDEIHEGWPMIWLHSKCVKATAAANKILILGRDV